MNITTTTRSVIDLLARQIAEGRLHPGEDLPAAPELARQFGFSHPTILKAFAALKAHGMVEGMQGKKYRLTTKPIDRLPSLKPRPRGNLPVGTSRSRTYRRIVHDVITGHFPSGKHVPNAKELTARYGVSLPTLKLALRDTAGAGFLSMQRHRFVAPRAAGNCTNGRIVLLGFGSRPGTIVQSTLDRDTLRHLEVACAAASIKLDLLAVLPNNAGFEIYEWGSSRRAALKPSDETIIGFVVLWSSHLYCIPDPVRRCAATGKPIALLDDIDSADAAKLCRAHRTIVRFNSAPFTAGERIGRYLLGLGHRSVAFFSAFNKAEWSQDRLNGLQRMFDVADYNACVKSFVYDNCAGMDDYHRLLQPDTDPGRMLAGFSEFKKRLPPAHRFCFERILHNGIDLEETLRDVIRSADIYDRMAPLFEEALADTALTAWVCVHDTLALAALDFCGRRKIRIPHRLSIVGFDNLPEDTDFGLTSYDFNASALASSMLHALLYPENFQRSHRTMSIAIDGFVVERASTAAFRG